MSFITYISIIVALSITIYFVSKLYKYVQVKIGFVMVSLVVFGLNLGLALFSLDVLRDLIADNRSIVFIVFVVVAMIFEFIGTLTKARHLFSFLILPNNEIQKIYSSGKYNVWARA